MERNDNVLRLENGTISDTVQTEITGADRGKLVPTDIGIIVNDFLTEHFPDIMNYNFTANVEQDFDHIAEGKVNWTSTIDEFYRLFHPSVTETMALRTEHKVGERILGEDPATGRQVSVKISRFGPVVQIGKQEEEEKPLFASLRKGQSMTTITLEEALKLFELPRQVGEYEDKVVTIGIGRFGPYIRHDAKYVSLPKEYDPMSVTLDEAIELIEAKRKQERERLIKTFPENEGLQILNGRFGPYITLDKANYKIPKGTDPTTLSFEDCMAIIKAAEESPKAGKGRKVAAAKGKEKAADAKKPAAKKTSTATKTKKAAAEKKPATAKKTTSTAKKETAEKKTTAKAKTSKAKKEVSE